MILVVIAILLLAAEWFFRQGNAIPSDRTYSQKRLLNQLMPKASAINTKIKLRVVDHPTFSSEYKTVSSNNVGFRGPNLDIPKSPGECRILILGDSFVADHFHDDKECFAAKLQHKLKAKYPEAVVNCASYGGEGWEDMLALLANRIVFLNPDFIIVLGGTASFVNCLWGTYQFLSLHKEERRKEWSSLAAFFPLLLEESVLFRHIRALFGRKIFVDRHFSDGVIHFSINFNHWAQRPFDPTIKSLPDVAKMLDFQLQHFKDTLNILLGNKIPAVVCFPPVRWKRQKVSFLEEKTFYYSETNKNKVPQHVVREHFDRYSMMLEEACREKELPFYNLGDEFDNYSDTNLWVDDEHLDTKGIDHLVSSIYEKIRLTFPKH